jgi:hypothetical protein
MVVHISKMEMISRKQALKVLESKLDNLMTTDYRDLDGDRLADVKRRFNRGYAILNFAVDHNITSALPPNEYIMIHVPSVNEAIKRSDDSFALFHLAIMMKKSELVYEILRRAKDKPSYNTLLLAELYRHGSPSGWLEMILETTTERLDRESAKIITQSYEMTMKLYPKIQHFGCKLYHSCTNEGRQALVRLDCPVDEKGLLRSVRKYVTQTMVKQMIALGAPINEKTITALKGHFMDRVIMSDQKVEEIEQRYKQLQQEYPEHSWSIGRWMTIMQSSQPFDEIRRMQNGLLPNWIPQCLEFISLVEPDVARRLEQY